jgi:hypothetical protein
VTSGYVPLDYDYGVYHLRLRRHSASSLPLPPCLFTAFPACPPARLVTGYCSRSLYLARSRALSRSLARSISLARALPRALVFFLVLFFSRDLHLLNPVLIFFEFRQSPGLSIFCCFGEKFLAKDFLFFFFVLFLVFFILWNCMHFPFLASFASASSWLPFSFSVFSLFLTWVCNCFVPSVVETG